MNIKNTVKRRSLRFSRNNQTVDSIAVANLKNNQQKTSHFMRQLKEK